MGMNVGIDLGTTFSAVARINNQGKPEIIKNSLGEQITPSVLCFQKDGMVLFGQDAKDMQLAGDTNTASFFKRAMGNDDFEVEFWGKPYSATDLSAILLRDLVEEAQKQTGEPIEGAVITVPAYFTHKERTATLQAGKQAGINVLSILNEPTAAAFAYGLMDRSEDQTVMIYDLGGGTFDVTIARISRKSITILGSDGNHELGGKDWDDCLANYMAQQFEDQTGVDLTEDDHAINALLVTAENVKKQLTSRDQVKAMVRCGTTRAQIEVTEDKFEEISDYLLGNTRSLIDKLLDELHLSWKDITGVILVGGSTRMRMVSKYVRQMSGKEPLHGVNVDEAVALGAAIRANIDAEGKSQKLAIGGANKSSGNRQSDRLVLGAKKITDATAHALGMIAENEDRSRYINSVIIPKNSPIPAASEKQYNFRTKNKDNELEVYVLQGAYDRVLDNIVIGKYVIRGIQPVKQNPSVITVKYMYDANGIIQVSARQQETGKDLSVEMQAVPEDMGWADGSPSELDPSVQIHAEAILAIDLSGSMSGEPIRQAVKAMHQFMESVDSSTTKVGIVAYADSSKWLIKPTDDYKHVNKLIDSIPRVDVGVCNRADPFPLINEYASKAHGPFKRNESNLLYTVVLTDGCWNDPDAAIKRANHCKKMEVQIIALGFGDADYKFLRKIATTEDMASLTTLSDLSNSFSKIAQVISEDTGNVGLRK